MTAVKDPRYLAFIVIALFLFTFHLISSSSFFRAWQDGSYGERQEVPAHDAALPFPVFPININTATFDELVLLPGIGDKTATRIIERRDRIGAFNSLDELKEIKGIGQAVVEKLNGLATAG
ncbi:MAG: helix-hairpin-helix domain-containing protein [Deltaproteobacteria bacterium]|nr:helix-hairpin-helix domain-containing protein [Deltaproteobacteria bacterium]